MGNGTECECETMIVSRSRTVHPQLTPLTLDGTVLKEFADLVILAVTFDAKMTFEKCCSSQRLGIMRKFWLGVLLSRVVLSCRLTP